MSLTGKNVSGLTAERIVEAVTEDNLSIPLPEEISGLIQTF